ncbi:MAG TPA: hypothetical protein VEI57_09035 [Nitrospirota bacterium]|nr:hypothetical protein [Nitrospirota bacterium]
MGHICGLGHCPDPKCIMFFSNNLKDTDRKETKFCSACRDKCGVSAVTRAEKRRRGVQR